MKKLILVIAILLTTVLGYSQQRKVVTKELQVTGLKDANGLGTDAKGNFVKVVLPKEKTAKEICEEDMLVDNTEEIPLQNEGNNMEVMTAVPEYGGKSLVVIGNNIAYNTTQKMTNFNEYRLYITTTIPITISHVESLTAPPIKFLNPVTYPAGEIDITEFLLEFYTLQGVTLTPESVNSHNNFSCYLFIDEAVDKTNFSGIRLAKKSSYTTSICRRLNGLENKAVPSIFTKSDTVTNIIPITKTSEATVFRREIILPDKIKFYSGTNHGEIDGTPSFYIGSKFDTEEDFLQNSLFGRLDKYVRTGILIQNKTSKDFVADGILLKATNSRWSKHRNGNAINLTEYGTQIMTLDTLHKEYRTSFACDKNYTRLIYNNGLSSAEISFIDLNKQFMRFQHPYDIQFISTSGGVNFNCTDVTVPEPNKDNSAVTKKYVDNLIAGAGGGELEKITENGNTGWRLKGANPDNYGNIGVNAVDLSYSDKASSTSGASGGYSIATGHSSVASGGYSTALGHTSIASGTAALATGDKSTASNYCSTAMGHSSVASGQSSCAIGSSATASGNFSTAMGLFVNAIGVHSVAMGYSAKARGDNSIAMGLGTVASSFSETALGPFNTPIYTPASSSSFNSADRLFCIGNGTSDTNRSDALIILKSGLTTLPSQTIAMQEAETTGKVVVTKEYLLQKVAELSARITALEANHP